MNVLPLEEVPLSASESRTSHPKAPVVEIPVLLEAWLLQALESAAGEQGMTTGALVRRLIREFVYYSTGDLPSG